MKFYNLNKRDKLVSLKEAVLTGIQGSDGLYMPQSIPAMPAGFFEKLSSLSLPEIGYEVSKVMLGEDLPDEAIRHITSTALNFDTPLKKVTDSISVLELFHGPTLAFKDVGARFMAALFEYLLKEDKQQIHILVATSGDTGGAVANAFWNKEGIRVTILYPSGKVSPLQELQLTTLGNNVGALEVNGTFDDCQAMVKHAFADTSLQSSVNLASANSINFARLFPQSFYYHYAYGQAIKLSTSANTQGQARSGKLVISVPSGNFGNLTAGLLAKRMGLPVHRFIAANNANDVVKDYLISGTYNTRSSVQTISNAMDVGAPSNFTRMLELYGGEWEEMITDISGYSFTDDETRACMQEVYNNTKYVLDPHGAVGHLALQAYLKGKDDTQGIFLETAHPSKFSEVVEDALKIKVPIPDALSQLVGRKEYKQKVNADYAELKKYLVG